MQSYWHINGDNFREAMRQLGIKKKVKVARTTKLPKGIGGRQTTTESHHQIWLSNDRPIWDANRILLHELAHCKQRETLGEDAELAYTLFQGIHGYENNPIELEAERFARQFMFDVQLLDAA